MPARIIRVKLRVVTPLFMGGASQEVSEWRLASIKGLLRYWYRASHYLLWARPKRSLDSGGLADDVDLRAEEARIFGGVDEEEGQGVFLLRTGRYPDQVVTTSKLEDVLGKAGQPLSYLAYGPIEKGKARSSALMGDAELVFCFKPGAGPNQDKDIEAVLGSLWLLCHLGGMGSRSRRGLGSVVWLDMEGDASALSFRFPRQASSVDELREHLRSTISRLCPQLPPEGTEYTALSAKTRIVLGSPRPSWAQALHDVGHALQLHRTYRCKSPKYPEDHDLVHDFTHTGRITAAPKRAVFGLPHNYYFSHDKISVKIEPSNPDGTVNRRASPLFVHIEELAGEHPSYVPVATLFPAQFLPSDVRLKVETRGKRPVMVSSPTAPWPPLDYRPIHNFLDDFRQATGGQEVVL